MLLPWHSHYARTNYYVWGNQCFCPCIVYTSFTLTKVYYNMPDDNIVCMCVCLDEKGGLSVNGFCPVPTIDPYWNSIISFCLSFNNIPVIRGAYNLSPQSQAPIRTLCIYYDRVGGHMCGGIHWSWCRIVPGGQKQSLRQTAGQKRWPEGMFMPSHVWGQGDPHSRKTFPPSHTTQEITKPG